MPRQDGTSLKSEVLSRPASKKTRSKALVASATRVSGRKPSDQKRATIQVEGWQSTLWGFYDMIGEYRYSVGWVGNLLSKALLFAAYEGKPIEKAEDPANVYMGKLFGGKQGQTEMLRQCGLHFTVAGEGYLVGSTTPDGANDEWLVAAATEIKDNGGGSYKVDNMVFDDALVIRMWRPHPVKPSLSDSPSKAILQILTEIHGLTQHVQAQIDSRLASAGILILPSEITFGSSPVNNKTATQTDDGEGGTIEDIEEHASQQDADGFIEILTETMMTAIADRGDAAALVPIVLQVAGEFVDKIQHLTFWSELDKEAINLRKEAVRRLALGMDMPPEVLEGTGDMNHWSSWQMEEAAIKAHTEPLLGVITSALTTGYLRSLLMDDGMAPAEAAKYTVEADTAKMRLRPNRSKEAQELYDRGALSLKAMLRENGFDAADAMVGQEVIDWLVRKVAQGSTTPELVEAALNRMGAKLEVVNPDRSDSERSGDEETQEERPIPSLQQHPTRTPPDMENDAVVAAASVMVFRALERAGNRLRTKMGAKIAGVSAPSTYMHVDLDVASQLDGLLEDSWGALDMFEPMFPGINMAELRGTLDSYTRTLLTERKPHSPELLRDYMALTKAPQ